MSKDPAFLFYPGDWLGGTLTFSRSHKGAYMDLLMAQFNQGRLTLEDIKTILDSDFESMWYQKLEGKFKKDKNGLYYNERLEYERDKRRKYSKSRRDNLTSSPKTMKPHMEPHMENENENINDSINGTKKGIVKGGKFVAPSLQDIKQFLTSEYQDYTEADNIFNFYTSNGWKVGKNPMKDWQASVRGWISRNKSDKKDQTNQDRHAEKLGGLKLSTL